MTDWQPIATAPKDGTAVLVAVAGIDELVGEAEYRFGRWWWPNNYLDPVEPEPTHWMPLPKAPQP